MLTAEQESVLAKIADERIKMNAIAEINARYEPQIIDLHNQINSLVSEKSIEITAVK